MLNEAEQVHSELKAFFVKVIEEKKYPEQAYKSCRGIIKLSGKVGIDRMLKACKIASISGTYNYRAIEDILNNISNEWDDRCNKSIERLIKNAAFRQNASIEEVDYRLDRNLDKNQIDRLADLTFVRETKDLFITGKTGIGKTYLATALGYRACQNGFKVLYANTYKLLGQLKIARVKGDILKELKKIFCMHPFDASSRMNLMDIIEDRYGKKTTIITSQFPVEDWYDLIGDKTIADAILDRLVHNALRIEIDGDSLRKVYTNKKCVPLKKLTLKCLTQHYFESTIRTAKFIIFSQIKQGAIFTSDLGGYFHRNLQ